MEVVVFILLWAIPALFVIYVVERVAGPTSSGIRELLRLFAAGEIDAEEYETRRKALKRLKT